MKIKYTSIEVPHYNDSFSRIVLDGRVWEIRFQYNKASDCWKFGIYDTFRNPLFQDIKIVPGIPLNLSFFRPAFPKVFFVAKTKLPRIGHEDFWNGDADFYFVEQVA